MDYWNVWHVNTNCERKVAQIPQECTQTAAALTLHGPRVPPFRRHPIRTRTRSTQLTFVLRGLCPPAHLTSVRANQYKRGARESLADREVHCPLDSTSRRLQVTRAPALLVVRHFQSTTAVALAPHWSSSSSRSNWQHKFLYGTQYTNATGAGPLLQAALLLASATTI